MTITQKFIVTGLLLLATLATGIWLGQLGKPLNSPLSGIHKLLSLAWVIFTAIYIYRAARLIELSAAHFAVIAILGVSMVALIASGSLLTVPNLATAAWLAVHRIATAFAVAAFAFSARLFMLGKQ